MALFFFLAALCAAFAVGAAEYQATPANYRELLARLVAGDTLLLAPGQYVNGLPVHGLTGNPDHPIVIAGPISGAPAVFPARRRANTVSIANSSYVTIRNLEIDGRGIAVHGVVAEGWAGFAHHITLDNLFIHDHDANQQINGISTKCPAWNWVIRNSVVVRAGTGMYLGDSDGGAPFIGGLIERNLVMDTIGYNIQVKHQGPRPRIPGMSEQPGTTIIKHNVFSKSANSATGETARPNLLVGHFPITGPGADDTYLIHGNLFYQNSTEALFQGEGNVALYNNLFVTRNSLAVVIRPHNDVPRRIAVFYNSIVAGGTGIQVTGGAPDAAQWVIGNVVFAGTPIVAEHAEGNVSGPLEAAPEFLLDPGAEPGALDLSPRQEKFSPRQVETGRFGRYPDADKDFDGRQRAGFMPGAYVGRPDWLPQLQRKPPFTVRERRDPSRR